MEIEIGSILKGKVKSITKFGAFVEVAPGKTGLVHISEISNAFVSDIAEYLTVGQEVAVKVVSADGGKINLSVRQAVQEPAVAVSAASRGNHVSDQTGGSSADDAFEGKLRRFMQDSDSRISDMRVHNERKNKRRGR